MELLEFWQIFRRRWWIPVILTVLVALLSAMQLRPWQSDPPTYSATIRLIVGVNPLEGEEHTQNYDPRYFAWLISEYLVDDFTEVVRSDLFAGRISERLAAQSIQVPGGMIQGSATTGKQHRIITLNFGWHDGEELSLIAAAAVAELEENATLYFRQLGTDGAHITLLDAPDVRTVSPGVRNQLDWPLRVLLALVAGTGIVFLIEYLDMSIRNRRELEEMGFVVLGEIPKY